MYRPKEWENPYQGGWARDDEGSLYPITQDAESDAFEAGADAMLEALKGKKDSEYWKAKWEEICLKPPVNGWLVFIPDEEKEE